MADEQGLKNAAIDSTTNNPARFGTPSELFYKAIVPIICVTVGSIGTKAWDLWFAKEPHLSYKINETVSFQNDKNLISIVTFTATSDGSKEVENVLCSFDTLGVEDVQLFPVDLHAKKELNATGIEVSVPTMNPGEELQVSIYFKNTMPPKLLPVKVKGKSISGSNKPLILPSISPHWLTVSIVEFMIILWIIFAIVREDLRAGKLRVEQQAEFDQIKENIHRHRVEWDARNSISTTPAK